MIHVCVDQGQGDGVWVDQDRVTRVWVDQGQGGPCLDGPGIG